MSTEKHFEDDRIRALLKKSVQQPPSTDFDEKLMERILQISPNKIQSVNGTELRLGKRYMILAFVLLLLSAFFSSQFLSGYFTGLSEIFTITTNYIFYGGMALLIPVLLFVLDSFLTEKYTIKKISLLSGI